MTIQETPTEALQGLLEYHKKRANSLLYTTPVSSPHYSRHQKQWADKDYHDNYVWLHNIEHELKNRGVA